MVHHTIDHHTIDLRVKRCLCVADPSLCHDEVVIPVNRGDFHVVGGKEIADRGGFLCRGRELSFEFLQ